MRSRQPFLAILCLLASLLVPGIASASTAAGAETRVKAFDFTEQVRIGVERSPDLTLLGAGLVSGGPRLLRGMGQELANDARRLRGLCEDVKGGLRDYFRKRGDSAAEGGAQKLTRLHADSSLKASTLDFWRGQSTDDIVESLTRSGPEQLRIRPDGTVLQGNHRIRVLEERSFDTSTLHGRADVVPVQPIAPWEAP